MDGSNGKEDENSLDFSTLPPRVILNDIFEFFVFLLDWKRLEKDELCLFGIFRKDRLRHIHFLFPCLFLKSVGGVGVFSDDPKQHVYAFTSKILFLRMDHVGSQVVRHLSSNSSDFERLRELHVVTGSNPGMGGDAYPKEYSSLFSDKNCFQNLERLGLYFCEGRHGINWKPDFRKNLKELSISLRRGGTIPSEFLDFEFSNLRNLYFSTTMRPRFGMFHMRERKDDVVVMKVPMIEIFSMSEIDKIGFEIGCEKTKSLRLLLKGTTLSFKRMILNYVEKGCPNLEVLQVDEESLKEITVEVKNILGNRIVVEEFKENKE